MKQITVQHQKKDFLILLTFRFITALVLVCQAVAAPTSLQSQSLYSTMLQYRFNAPVTVSLNFGLPIHSTISSAQNLNSNNLQSMEYFKNMPLSASFTWQPTDKMIFQLNVERNTYSNLFFDYYHPFDYSRSFFQQPSTVTESRNTEKNK